MKRLMIMVLAVLTLTSCAGKGEAEDKSQQADLISFNSNQNIMNVYDNADNASKNNYDTQKAIWISYIDLSTMLTGKTEDEFTINISKALDNISDAGLNTVYVH